MEVDENDALDRQTSATKKGFPLTQWMAHIPKNNVGDVRDISDQAFWTLSSCKTDGFGIQQLLDDNIEQYWQSDGPQPHIVTIEFSKKTDISFLLLYLDYKTDESYTPSKVVVHLGSSVLDLDEGLAVMFSEPVGWQDYSRTFRAACIICKMGPSSLSIRRVRTKCAISGKYHHCSSCRLRDQVIDLRESNGRPARAFVLQLQVVQNHQNGRDTHIRQMRVIGPARTRLDTGMKTLISAGTDINNVPLKFTSQAIARFSNFR